MISTGSSDTGRQRYRGPLSRLRGDTPKPLAPTQTHIDLEEEDPMPYETLLYNADLVIASEDARIGTAYSRMWGCYLTGMWLYRLGLTRAKEHALTGKPLSGSEAAEIGLINTAVPFDRLESEVRERAAQL